MLFFVLGPFGLPLLYQSPAFKKYEKFALTAAVLVYTAALLTQTFTLSQKIVSQYLRP
jgi:hypothetical protein